MVAVKTIPENPHSVPGSLAVFTLGHWLVCLGQHRPSLTLALDGRPAAQAPASGLPGSLISRGDVFNLQNDSGTKGESLHSSGIAGLITALSNYYPFAEEASRYGNNTLW